MRLEAAENFVCPACRGVLRLAQGTVTSPQDSDVTTGSLQCVECDAGYPIIRSMPRFVPSEDYAKSFGFQWNQFPTLQLDKVMQNDLSRQRYYATTGWPSRLKGQRILEPGCGCGRFTQIALESGAEVFSFDLSSAVEVACHNNHGNANLTIFQGSIYRLPLRKGMFDKILCLGVLQHCPDVKRAFLSLIPYLRDGGEIVIDVYQRHEFLPPLKYWVRPLVQWMRPETLFQLLRVIIPLLFKAKKTVNRIPFVGPRLARIIPIGPLSHGPGLNRPDEQLKQIKTLSAFDMLSPKYDQPQRAEDVRAWFEEAGLTDVEVRRGYNGINARGVKRQIRGSATENSSEMIQLGNDKS